MPDNSLIARGSRKRYGSTDALDGFDLDVRSGSIHGLLGPNGAGKSTAVRALTTLIDLDGGAATVGGVDLRSEPAKVRSRVGSVGQNAAVDEILGGRQNLTMFGRLFGLSKSAAISRGDELLDRFGLKDAATRPVSAYSGGMRRRLDIAASLILRPAVLFLDEPTTGLDPSGRNEVWRSIREVAEAGTTVLLTTQYLDEADQLAERISVMKAGRVIVEGSPSQLKREFGGDLVVVVVSDPSSLPAATRIVEAVTGTTATIVEDERMCSAPTGSGATALVEVVRALDADAIAVDDLNLRRPTLDEVFLTLTTEVAA